MTRRALLALPFLCAINRIEARASGVHLTGTLGGPDTDGGYFDLVNDEGKGQRDLILATPTDSAIYPHLKALVGYPIQVSVFRP